VHASPKQDIPLDIPLGKLWLEPDELSGGVEIQHHIIHKKLIKSIC
ncbi:hypothetical protein HNQ74_001538, partial [Bartonella doshiae]|nr:hypothetical protein [Bartonella doshiae]